VRHPVRAALAVIVSALIGGGAVLVLGGTGERAKPKGPPVPRGLEKRAAISGRRPHLIAGSPAPGRAQPGEIGPRGGPPPVEVAIPQVGISTRVGPVGASHDRIEAPPVTRAGWYRDGPRPGEPGRTVIIGHLDTRRGPAVFANLPSVSRGDTVVVTDAAGRGHNYRVVRVISVPKHLFRASEVFAPTPASTLALITCGGRFDRRSGHYERNVVVFARLRSVHASL
jgi:Sortase domain